MTFNTEDMSIDQKDRLATLVAAQMAQNYQGGPPQQVATAISKKSEPDSSSGASSSTGARVRTAGGAVLDKTQQPTPKPPSKAQTSSFPVSELERQELKQPSRVQESQSERVVETKGKSAVSAASNQRGAVSTAASFAPDSTAKAAKDLHLESAQTAERLDKKLSRLRQLATAESRMINWTPQMAIEWLELLWAVHDDMPTDVLPKLCEAFATYRISGCKILQVHLLVFFWLLTHTCHVPTATLKELTAPQILKVLVEPSGLQPNVADLISQKRDQHCAAEAAFARVFVTEADATIKQAD